MYIRTLFYFKIEKNKKERQGNKKKQHNLILRKMFVVGRELEILDSGGQRADHYTTKDLQLERVFVLFIDNRYL